jgi:predicted ATPase
MIDEILLKFGSSKNSSPLEFKPGPITVFVGPNNSGKSLILKEIEALAKGGDQAFSKIIDKLNFSLPKREEAKEILLSKLPNIPRYGPIEEGQIRITKLNPISGPETTPAFYLKELLDLIENKKNFSFICYYFVRLFTIRIDGKTRLSLTEKKATGDLLSTPTNHLTSLFTDDNIRRELRQITADAFGLYFTLDPTELGSLRIRMSSKEPDDNLEEQALDSRAREFHKNAIDISEFSDGIKAFTGLIAAIMSSDYRIMLIDEPEAFLHPPLIKKLGSNLARLASRREGNVLASTHSPDFVMGCVQSGKELNIVRLTYKEGSATARLLPSQRLQTMMRDPLLRSTGVLGALFHEGAIVCEADSDRSFYQEVNERILSFDKDGADNCLFLNTQGKQTVCRIVEPLREMGIPAAAIVDLDIIKKGDELKALLKSCFVPQALITSWGQLRGEVYKHFTGSNLDPKKDGIHKLSSQDQESVRNFISNLSDYGIFVVPGGELESWLKNLGASGHSPKWLIDIFEKMGSDPEAQDYIKPMDGDVWNFIKDVAKWISNPNRLGMPK